MMSIVQDVDRKRYSNREAWGRGYVRLATLVKQGVTDRKFEVVFSELRPPCSTEAANDSMQDGKCVGKRRQTRTLTSSAR